MLRSMLLCAIFACMFATASGAQSNQSGLEGNWIVRWAGDRTNENELSLRTLNGRLSGTYVNDEKSPCTATGNHDPQSNAFAVTIVCPKWDIRMQGNLSANGLTASGDYYSYVNSRGRFEMRKR